MSLPAVIVAPDPAPPSLTGVADQGRRAWDDVSGEVGQLRIRVWQPLAAPGARGLSLNTLLEPLDTREGSVHFIRIIAGKIVGAVRLTMNYLPNSILDRVPNARTHGSALISRLVVDEGHRGVGIAKLLELTCLDYASSCGQRFAWAEATPTTADPFKRMGFAAVSEYVETEAIFIKQHITIVRKELR